MQQGVQIDLIAEERLSEMTSMEKIHMILDNVRDGRIVILEKGLTPEEQSRLIEMTMREILPDGFNGIEIETYPSRDDAPGFLRRLLGKTTRESHLTVIGPANQLRMIPKGQGYDQCLGFLAVIRMSHTCAKCGKVYPDSSQRNMDRDSLFGNNNYCDIRRYTWCLLWMIPLRRALIIKTDLPFPSEGVTVAAVLTTTVGGETASTEKGKTKGGGISGIWLAVGVIVSALLKFSQVALNTVSGTIQGIVNIGKYNTGGGDKPAYIYGGTAASPALLGVGWIIGPKISSFVFVGGLLGWVILAPLIALSTGLPTPAISDPEVLKDVLDIRVRGS